MPTSEHPIQTFQWGDYTAKPATTYRYKVVPVYGKPKLIELDEQSATSIEITTEAEQGGAGKDGQATHDIYFNRGAAGSQAYARKFGSYHPGVCQFVFCDGSVRAIRNSIDTANLRRLAVRNDGEVITFSD